MDWTDLPRWEDVVLAAAGWLACWALVGSLRQRRFPALTTSVQNAVYLLAAIAAMASLGLWATAATNVVMCALWAALAWGAHSARRRALAGDPPSAAEPS